MVRCRTTSRRRRSSLGAAALAALCLVLAACGSGTAGVSASNPTALPGAQKCPPPLTTTTPGGEQRITVAGQTRAFYVWAPTGYTGRTPVPVVVDFHGLGQQALDYETHFSAMSLEGPPRGYLVVAPQAGTPGGTSIWKFPGYTTGETEAPFVQQLLATLSSRYCVDQKRLYASGISEGAGLTTWLSCTQTTWAAVAPLSGVNLAQPCPMAPPVPVVAFHGTADSILAFTGNTDVYATPPAGEAYIGDVQADVDAWAARNGCGPKRVDSVAAPATIRRVYLGCKPGDEVNLYISKGSGHTYPGGPVETPAAVVAALGGQSQTLDASQVALDFFDAHRKP